MGNGVKVLLVALLILSVVVVAKIVQDRSEPDGSSPGEVAASGPTEKDSGDDQRSSANPSPSTANRQSASAADSTPSSSSPQGTVSSGTRRPGGRVISQGLAARPSAARPADRGTTSSSDSRRATQFSVRSNRLGATPNGSAAAQKSGERGDAPTDSPGTGSPTKPSDDERDNDVAVTIAPDGDAPGGFRPQKPPTARRNTTTSANINAKADSDPGTFSRSSTSLDQLVKNSTSDGSGDAQKPPASLSFASQSSQSPKSIGGTSHAFDQPISGDRTSRKPRDATPSFKPVQPDSPSLPRQHTVEKNDSYWALAKRFYGLANVNHFRKIERANNGKQLVPGMTVTIPALSSEDTSTSPSTRTSPDAQPRDGASSSSSSSKNRSHKKTADGKYYLHDVRRGETLSGLARTYYNDPRNYAPIEKANPDVRYLGLRAGETLKIPVDPR